MRFACVAALLLLVAVVLAQQQVPVRVIQSARDTGDRLTEKPMIYMTSNAHIVAPNTIKSTSFDDIIISKLMVFIYLSFCGKHFPRNLWIRRCVHGSIRLCPVSSPRGRAAASSGSLLWRWW